MDIDGFGPEAHLSALHGQVYPVLVCMTCGAVVHQQMVSTHADWHGAISGVAIEQTKLIDQLQRRVQELEQGQTDHVQLHTQ